MIRFISPQLQQVVRNKIKIEYPVPLGSRSLGIRPGGRSGFVFPRLAGVRFLGTGR
jgi:hypothetical protein